MEQVTMPKLGLTMTEGTVSKWKVSPGDRIKKEEVLLVVATDKLTYDVTSPIDGVVLEILVNEGETVPVGNVLAVLGEAGEKISAADRQGERPEPGLKEAVKRPSTSTPLSREVETNEDVPGPGSKGQTAAVSPLARKWARSFGLDIGSIEGSGPGGRVVKDDVMKASARYRATPLARKIAREAGITVQEIPGTGPMGRTTAGDVKAYLASPPKERIRVSPVAAKLAEDLEVPLETIKVSGRIMKDDVLRAAGAAKGSGTVKRRVPLTPMRKVIAERMTFSASTIPSVFFNIETDFTEFISFRKALNEELEGSGVKVSFNDILMKICARALVEMPMANASYDPERNEYILHDDVNIGIAVAVEGGLLVPNVKKIQEKPLPVIARESLELVNKARKNRLLPEEMQGGTFTITNLGMFGIHDFIPIINPPEACILAVNAVTERPVYRDGQVVVRPISMIGLTADHRILDGADAARFLARVRELVEKPWMTLVQEWQTDKWSVN